MTRGVVLAAALSLAIGCSKPPPSDPLQLDANWLTVENQTPDRWSDVEIWINSYYRFTVSSVEPGGRFKVPLGSFVAAYGQRFDLKKAPLTDLRLTGKRPDGTTFEIKKRPEKSGLAGALEGLGGKR